MSDREVQDADAAEDMPQRSGSGAALLGADGMQRAGSARSDDGAPQSLARVASSELAALPQTAVSSRRTAGADHSGAGRIASHAAYGIAGV